MALDVGRADDNALVITLTRTCDIRTAARTRSDRTGLLRYEDVHRSARDFTGQRYYLFPGGCLTLSFDVRGEAAAATASMIARSVSVIKRADLREHVRLYSRGRFYLDPTPRS